MSRPVAGCALARVHLYARDGVTSRGILNGGDDTDGGTSDLTWTWAKSIDGSACSFTASALDPAMVADPSMLEDALAIVELNVGGTWTEVGTPYVLAPGTGTAIGAGEAAAYQFQPAGVGAAVGLCGEWLVLHRGGIINRRGPTDRYIGWQSLGFDDSGWHVPTEVDPATDLSITDAKYGEPAGWPSAADAATWVYRKNAADGGNDGGLTLFRFGSFTVATARKYRIGFSCDEECTVYLDGPGWGGVFASSSDQETGYMNYNREGEVLQPGTYYVAAEMTTVNSDGGDGFDAMRLFVATVDEKDRVDDVVILSGSDTVVWRQLKTDVRPGFTPDEVIEILRSENSTWGIPSADLLTVVATDTMPDGEERVWAVLTPVSQCLSDLEIDVHIDVDTSWNLSVTADPTVDVSATLGLVAGAVPATSSMNVEGLGWSSDGTIGTRVGVLTNDGFAEYIDTAAEATTAARAIPLESGASGSVAKGVLYAADAVAQSVKVRRNYHADPAGITGNVPFVDVKTCYRIAALDYMKAAEDQMVLSITGTNQTTRASFSYDLGKP